MMKQFILTFIIFVLSALLIMSVRSCNTERQEKEAAKEMFQQALKNGPKAPLVPVETVYDTVWQAERNTYEPTIIAADDNLSTGISAAYVDSISRALDISQKNVTDLTKANIRLNAKLKLAFHQTDSVTGRLWAAYKDKVFDIKYYPDSNEMEIKANVGLNLVGHKTRDNIFQQWKYRADAWLTDDRFSLNQFNQVKRDLPKRSRFGVDLFVGPVYTQTGIEPVVFGIGLGYRLIEF